MRRSTAAILILVVASALSAAWFFWALSPAGPERSVVCRIEEGDSWKQVAERLSSRGVIRSSVAARLYLVFSRLGKHPPPPGTHEVSPSLSTPAVLRSIGNRTALLVRITVPEGRNVSWIARTLQEKGVCSQAQFLSLCQEPGQLRQRFPFLPPRLGLEGYLFPDTYFFRRGTSAEAVVCSMLSVFQRRLKQAAIPMDEQLHRLVTIASMVELEAKRDEERPIIAGVIQARLRRGMRLEIDATVLYALGKWKSRVLYRDLEHPSPYNTYRNHGLPPGPICNPGLASLKAAANPLPTDYLYYVARKDGSHLFARTFEEHLANRRRVASEARR